MVPMISYQVITHLVNNFVIKFHEFTNVKLKLLEIQIHTQYTVVSTHIFHSRYTLDHIIMIHIRYIHLNQKRKEKNCFSFLKWHNYRIFFKTYLLRIATDECNGENLRLLLMLQIKLVFWTASTKINDGLKKRTHSLL